MFLFNSELACQIWLLFFVSLFTNENVNLIVEFCKVVAGVVVMLVLNNTAEKNEKL